MRIWLLLLAALLMWTVGAGAAAAQSPLDCSAAPQNICEDAELLALEGERSALVGQLSALDPQNPALASEQTWLDGLGACEDEAACYRTAYLNHNQMLRQHLAALPGAIAEAPPEAPPDAAPIEEPPPEREEASRPRTRDDARGPARETYVASGLPGWGFFTAIGVTLLILFALLRTLRRNREELRAQQAQLRDGWR
jgi:hypothetical protein